MKWCKYVMLLSIVASTRLAGVAWSDTLDLMGGNSFNWGIGWMGEAYGDSGWCGDTVKVDTVVSIDTVDSIITIITSDTVAGVVTLDTVDTIVRVVNIDTVKVPTLIDCLGLFRPDTGGLTPGVTYLDYNYKFRNYYAQLPIQWNNWQGYDSMIVGSYKKLMVVYKGLLPDHQAKLEFFYAAWGALRDTTKDPARGDGIALLLPSPDKWDTVVVAIPDSVSLPGITGLVFVIQNQEGMGGVTSELGNIKVNRIALIYDEEIAVNKMAGRKKIASRSYFTPALGSVNLTVYSLKGEVLVNKTVNVQSGRQYSVRRFVRDNCGVLASQVRMVKIKGEGVEISAPMW